MQPKGEKREGSWVTNSPADTHTKHVSRRAGLGVRTVPTSCVPPSGVVEALMDRRTHQDRLMSESGCVSADVVGARIVHRWCNWFRIPHGDRCRRRCAGRDDALEGGV